MAGRWSRVDHHCGRLRRSSSSVIRSPAVKVDVDGKPGNEGHGNRKVLDIPRLTAGPACSWRISPTTVV